jgi:hypothetical protein
MVGMNSVNPLNLPPTKEVRKIEIQKVVEGFDMEQSGGIQDSSASIDMGGGVYGDVYKNNYDSLYHGQYDNDPFDLTSDVFHNDPPKKNKRNND